MKFYELASVIDDNEFTLHIANDDMSDKFRVYKDDDFGLFLWDFGFADVLGIATICGDLEVFLWSCVPCAGLTDWQYDIIGEADAGRFLLDTANNLEEAFVKADEFRRRITNAIVMINDAV